MAAGGAAAVAVAGAVVIGGVFSFAGAAAAGGLKAGISVLGDCFAESPPPCPRKLKSGFRSGVEWLRFAVEAGLAAEGVSAGGVDFGGAGEGGVTTVGTGIACLAGAGAVAGWGEFCGAFSGAGVAGCVNTGI